MAAPRDAAAERTADWRSAMPAWSRTQRRLVQVFGVVFAALVASGPLLWWSLPPARTRASVPAPLWSLASVGRGEWMRDLDRHLKESSWLTFWLRGWRNELLLRANLLDPPAVVIGRDGWMYLRSSLPWDGDALARTRERRRAVMAAAKSWAQQHGIWLLAVPVPDKSTIYPEFLPAGTLPPGRETVYGAILDDLAAAGVPALDVRALLLAAKASRPERLLFLRRDSHWAQSARAEVAAAIARRVSTQLPDLRLSPATGVTVHPPVETLLFPDLACMLGVRLLENAAPEATPASLHWLMEPGSTRYATVGEGAAMTLLPMSPPGASVALCGTSYSTGLVTEIVDALGAHVDARGVQPAGNSFRGLRKVMADVAEGTFAPRIVVWEFVERDYLATWLIVESL